MRASSPTRVYVFFHLFLPTQIVSFSLWFLSSSMCLCSSLCCFLHAYSHPSHRCRILFLVFCLRAWSVSLLCSGTRYGIGIIVYCGWLVAVHCITCLLLSINWAFEWMNRTSIQHDHPSVCFACQGRQPWRPSKPGHVTSVVKPNVDRASPM